MGAPALALTAFKIAVAGRSAALTRLKRVGVHGQTHGTAGLTPLEAGVLKNNVKPFVLGLLFNQAGARHHQGVDRRSDLVAFGVPGGNAQVFYAGIGTRADKNPVNRNVRYGSTGLQVHIGQGPLRGLLCFRRGHIGRVRHAAGNIRHHARIRPPSDLRSDVLGFQFYGLIEAGVRVGRQLLPGCYRLLEQRALGRKRTVLDIGKRLFIRRNHTGPRAALNGHIAQRHAAFHGQRPDGRTRVFDDMPGSAGRSDFADNGQDNILGRAPLG